MAKWQQRVDEMGGGAAGDASSGKPLLARLEDALRRPLRAGLDPDGGGRLEPWAAGLLKAQDQWLAQRGGWFNRARRARLLGVTAKALWRWAQVPGEAAARGAAAAGGSGGPAGGGGRPSPGAGGGQGRAGAWLAGRGLEVVPVARDGDSAYRALMAVAWGHLRGLLGQDPTPGLLRGYLARVLEHDRDLEAGREPATGTWSSRGRGRTAPPRGRRTSR